MSQEGNLLERMKYLFSENDGGRLELNAEELEMIKNIFRFRDKDAKDIMTHRKNIVAVDGDMKLCETLPYMLEQRYSRFPVYVEDIDTIVGVLHLRDAMNCYLDEELRELPVKELGQYMRPAGFIPETKSIDKVFQIMKKEKNHMHIVLDEYGQTAGLVAMEDILEEIVGNILDEYDEEEEFVVQHADGTYIAQGMTEIEDLEKVLDIKFEGDDFETLNGFLISRLEKIPSEDETCVVEYEGYRFTVLSVKENIIQSVRIESL